MHSFPQGDNLRIATPMLAAIKIYSIISALISTTFRFISIFLCYTGCHKYVPFTRFADWRQSSVQQNEIITNMTTAILERLDQAILEVIDSLKLAQQTTAIGALF
jgi:hypothetical protein